MEIVVAQQAGRVPITVFHIKGDIDSSTNQQVQTQLVSPTSRVSEVLKMSGIDMMIESYRSVPEAVASF